MDYLLNMKVHNLYENYQNVLNLIINGLPSKLKEYMYKYADAFYEVLNLIINGLPSKPKCNIIGNE